MTEDRVVIVMATYNNADIIEKTILSCMNQDYLNLHLVITDDESKDGTGNIIKELKKTYQNIHLIEMEHCERGIGRKLAIEKAYDLDADYIYIIDSDMRLKDNFINECLLYFKNNPQIGALVIPELPFSDYNNYFSKVKVFERKIINNAGESIGKNSIEAARFWKVDEYKKTGGLNPKQISFEEIQPTIRYIEMGGLIKRATFTGVYHDEKYVTLENLLKKKTYYFSVMNKTLESEKDGVLKALSRWYFFRSVLYRPTNIIEYIKHPLLTLGMFYMYLRLSFIGMKQIILKR